MLILNLFIYFFLNCLTSQVISNSEGHTDLVTELNTASVKPSGPSVEFYCTAHNFSPAALNETRSNARIFVLRWFKWRCMADPRRSLPRGRDLLC